MKQQVPSVDGWGTVHLPPFSVPLSIYMSERAKAGFIRLSRTGAFSSREWIDVSEIRRVVDEYHGPLVIRARKSYPVDVSEEVIAGVRVNEVVPRSKIPRGCRKRVLINLHGGGFLTGARFGGLAESIPIASVSGIRVLSIDYRMAPEHRFPAASEDVESVYKELLTSCRAEDIGIYGCSSGGLLVGEAVAWLWARQLPRPGAIGMFCTGLDATAGGDSSYLSTQVNAPFISPPPSTSSAGAVPPSPYFSVEDMQNSLAFPALDPTVLSRFPPALLITGTRDRFMSPTVYAHRQLKKAGVNASLQVWEGMWHGFINECEMPEAVEAYQEVSNFFARHLGNRSDCLNPMVMSGLFDDPI